MPGSACAGTERSAPGESPGRRHQQFALGRDSNSHLLIFSTRTFQSPPLTLKGRKRRQTAINETVWYESVVWQVEAVNEALSFTFLSMRDWAW